MSVSLMPPGTMRTIPEALSYWAAATPDAVAVLSPGREPATYRQVQDAVELLALELRARGLGRQDGIALLVPEGPELCLALLATISVGIAVPLPWPSPPAEYERILANPRVRAVISGEAVSAALELRDQRLPVLTLHPGGSGRLEDLGVDGERLGPPTPEEHPDPDDIALILHSSGTTGRPKLVPRLHRAIISSCRTFIEDRGITSADRCLCLARAAYSQGISGVMLPVFAGATQISLPGLDLDEMPDWLRDFRPTFLTSTPAVLRHLAADQGVLLDALRQSPLRCIHSSAGPLSTDEIEQLESILEVRILNGYAMSEASGIASESYTGYQRASGAVGLPRCEVRIVDEHGVPGGPGATGEIVVRGPRVFPGYLDDSEANAAAFLPGGWFRTGDVGYLRDGHLFVRGRRDELINRGGAKIAPVEVDHALLSHPAVAEAAVFAVPDIRLGEDIVAAVVFRPDMTASQRELRTWLLDRLSRHKVPRRIWVVDALPRTRTGKVQRGELSYRWREEQE